MYLNCIAATDVKENLLLEQLNQRVQRNHHMVISFSIKSLLRFGYLLMESDELKEHLQYIVPQVKLVLIKEPGQPYSVSGPLDLEKLVEPLKHYSDEHFVSFHLDVYCRVTGYHIVAQGSLTENMVHPREVFKAALLGNAFGVVLAHNHPSGVLTPSDADIFATRALIRCGNLLGVNLFDHIIVSSEGLYSFRAAQSDLWLNNSPEDNKRDSQAIDTDFWRHADVARQCDPNNPV